MEKNIIYNEDCFVTIGKMSENGDKVDCVLTSPPYNMTKRKGGYADTGRYDVYEDWKTEEDYLKWTVDLFNGFDGILNENRTLLYGKRSKDCRFLQTAKDFVEIGSMCLFL